MRTPPRPRTSGPAERTPSSPRRSCRPAGSADRPRARGPRLHGRGESNQGIAQELVVTEAAVEKHVTSIFHKLGLGPTPTEHRRVLAVLAYLRGSPG